MISNIDVKANSPYGAWIVLSSIIKDDNSERVKDSVKTNLERIRINVSESSQEYVAGAKARANAFRYCNAEVRDEEICSRISTDITNLYQKALPFRISFPSTAWSLVSLKRRSLKSFRRERR